MGQPLGLLRVSAPAECVILSRGVGPPACSACTLAEMESGLASCPCGAVVRLTDAGRPRNHNIPGNGPCTRPRDDYELPDCAYCHQHAYALMEDPVPPGTCHSPMYHPERWVHRGREVGNSAAAGELVGVTGKQYQWLTKTPPEGRRRAPQHLGIRHDGVRFYSLDAVRKFTANRPGPGAWSRDDDA